MTRTELIQHFIDKRGYKSYLEIGCFRNDNFNKIKCDSKVSIDPDPEAKATRCMTSDAFFDEIADYKCNDEFDIIFIDGLHEHKQVWRDIENSLKHLKKGGVIIMHDCCPTSAYTARWDDKSHQNEEWYGDVYKAYMKARNDLCCDVYVIPEDCGCGVIDTSKYCPEKEDNKPLNMEEITYDDYHIAKEIGIYGERSYDDNL